MTAPSTPDMPVLRPQASSVDRRRFLDLAGKGCLVTGAVLSQADWPLAAAEETPSAGAVSSESLVKLLYESLTPGQREKICFAWDYHDPKRGLLRTRVANNWDITDEFINGDFYTKDQRALIRAIFEGLYNPEWIPRIDRQLDDDSGGFGESNSIAIFGQPGSDQFEFVLTGRHMTVRCDGNTAEHVAFGGPIFYGHAADGFNEGPDHPGNVFWPQAQEANKLYQILDGRQQKMALVSKGLPREQNVGFQGLGGKFLGIPVTELSGDQSEHLQTVLRKLMEPYREVDQQEATEALAKQGGLERCYLAFFQEGDIGKDQVWDVWRLEGPSFVWHFRGSPHVHVWANVADAPSVELNA